MKDDPKRLTPEMFGYSDPDAWTTPDDPLDWLEHDLRVDAANVDVRRGAHDEQAGLSRDDNPFVFREENRMRRGVMSQRARDWLDGWKASGNHYGRFNREADDLARAALEAQIQKDILDLTPLDGD